MSTLLTKGSVPRSARRETLTHFDRLVFSGGGNRCFWQAGFWTAIESSLQEPSEIAAVSAGAAIACALFAGTFESGFEDHKRAVQRNPYNLQIRNLLNPKPIFPHGAMYRSAILASIDAAALTRLHKGPEIRIAMSHPPPWASTPLAVLLGVVSMGLDAVNGADVNAAAARRMGFKPVYESVKDCHTPDELADLIVASSCVPPLTPLVQRNGVPVFDGGLVGNVPTDQPRKKGTSTLVLLTRSFNRLPHAPGQTYVQPSRPIPVGTWDYTNDAALQEAFDLGKSDGARFLAAANAQTNSLQRTL